MIPELIRVRLAARSEGRCEVELYGCRGRATDAHHRITTKAGGRHGEAADAHHVLSNLLHLCRPCHSWITDHPAESYAGGFSLREGDKPTQQPVVYRGSLSLLFDSGSVMYCGVVLDE